MPTNTYYLIGWNLLTKSWLGFKVTSRWQIHIFANKCIHFSPEKNNWQSCRFHFEMEFVYVIPKSSIFGAHFLGTGTDFVKQFYHNWGDSTKFGPQVSTVSPDDNYSLYNRKEHCTAGLYFYLIGFNQRWNNIGIS